MGWCKYLCDIYLRYLLLGQTAPLVDNISSPNVRVYAQNLIVTKDELVPSTDTERKVFVPVLTSKFQV